MARSRCMKAIRLDVLKGNLPARRAYEKIGFQYRGTVPMYYEDTGGKEFEMFEIVV